MAHPLEAVLGDPWQFLERAVDGPLHPGGREATAALLDRAGVDGSTRLLDVGCGAGDALTLARDRGARALGLDRQPSGPDAVRGDLLALPFADGAVDVVLGECVLCLSPDLGRTLAEVERVLAPGGRLALSDVTVEDEPPDLPAPLDEMFCLGTAPERAALRRAVDDAGLEIEEVRTHREDVLAMRDRLLESVDHERLFSLMGERGARLREGVDDLEAAVESGRVGYASIVATA